MPYTMTPGVGLAGPTKPKSPIDALAEFLGVDPATVANDNPTAPDAGSDAGSPEPPSSFATPSAPVPASSGTSTAYDFGNGHTGSFRGMSQGSLATPFEQDQTAQATAADAKDAERTKQAMVLHDFFNPDAVRQRQEELAGKLAIGRIPGETARDVAHITAQGGLDRQGIANEGTLAVAETAAGAKSGTGGRLPSGLMERVAGAHTALNTLDELEQLYPKVQGFINGMGPVAGRMSEFMQGVPGMPSNPDFNGFTARSSTLANAVIKAITGAQMSEPEAVRIMKQIPTVHDRSDVWKSKTTAMRSNLASTVENIHNENQSGQGGPGLSRERLLQMAASLGISVGGDSGADPYANPDYQPQ